MINRRESAVRTANGTACGASVHIDTNEQTVRALGSNYTHSPSKACGLVTSWTKWLQPDTALAFRRAYARSAAYGHTDQCRSGPGRSHRRRCKRVEAHWSVPVHARRIPMRLQERWVPDVHDMVIPDFIVQRPRLADGRGHLRFFCYAERWVWDAVGCGCRDQQSWRSGER